ncbi:MAG: SGNH/GDSL hydrolase family protein [Patescibacteria group bacterium]
MGDSMVDTMGENLDYLKESLRARYPETYFNFYNYGIGGQNVAQGLDRFNQSFTYQTRNYPPIGEISADIIIIASFAYNPFSPHNRDQHWLTLTELVTTAKQTGADVYMLAEIAPLSTGFGDGPGGINWPPDLANQQAENIRQQLENAVSLSRSLGVPLINAYAKSTVDSQFGDRVYISAHDGIHPSVEGHLLMADLIAQTIVLK